jgi:hypothetical protein
MMHYPVSTHGRCLHELLVHGDVEPGVVGGRDVLEAEAEGLDAQHRTVVGDEDEPGEAGQAHVSLHVRLQVNVGVVDDKVCVAVAVAVAVPCRPCRLVSDAVVRGGRESARGIAVFSSHIHHDADAAVVVHLGLRGRRGQDPVRHVHLDGVARAAPHHQEDKGEQEDHGLDVATLERERGEGQGTESDELFRFHVFFLFFLLLFLFCAAAAPSDTSGQSRNLR